MCNWSLYGILLITGLFLIIFSFILVQIDIVNPLTGQEASIFNTIIEWITPF